MLGVIYSLGYNMVRNVRFGSIGSKLRLFFLVRLGCRLSKTCYIGPNVTIVYPINLIVGQNVSIHEGCYIDASGVIDIGDDVSIAHGCSLISFNHTYYDKRVPIKSQPLSMKKITIDKNCWIGCKAIILAGAHIGQGSVVAAGSVANNKYPEFCILGGVPARVLKYR